MSWSGRSGYACWTGRAAAACHRRWQRRAAARSAGLAGVADAVAAAAAFRAGDVGRVRIGTGATACIYLLPAVLAAAKRRMPGLEVIVATGNSAAMVQQVEAGDLDLALVTLPVAAAPALSVSPLLTDALVALIPAVWRRTLPAQLPGAGRERWAARWVARLPLILYEPAGSTRALIDGWFRAAGVTAVPAMQLDSVEAIKVLVGGGRGPRCCPRWHCPSRWPARSSGDCIRCCNGSSAIVLRREKIMDRGLRVMLDALASAPNRSTVRN